MCVCPVTHWSLLQNTKLECLLLMIKTYWDTLPVISEGILFSILPLASDLIILSFEILYYYLKSPYWFLPPLFQLVPSSTLYPTLVTYLSDPKDFWRSLPIHSSTLNNQSTLLYTTLISGFLGHFPGGVLGFSFCFWMSAVKLVIYSGIYWSSPFVMAFESLKSKLTFSLETWEGITFRVQGKSIGLSWH